MTQCQPGHLYSDEGHMFSILKDNANILNSCRMLDMEHDNKQNEDLQGSGEDKGKEFINLKVVGQDNSEVHFKVKMTGKNLRNKNTNCF